MRVLTLGDVVGRIGLTYLEDTLWEIRKKHRIDFTVANGENASEIRGISAKDAQRLLQAGADVITLGNHAFGQRDLYPLLEQGRQIVRPANFPPSAPGPSYCYPWFHLFKEYFQK